MDLMKVIIEVELEGLGSALKKAREASKLSLVAAGARSGMSGTNFNRIENEEFKGVPLTTLVRAAHAVGLDLTKYFGDWATSIPGVNLTGDASDD